MNVEWTRIKEFEHLRGWLLYDGECPLCCRWAERLEPILTRRNFDLAPLQSPWVEECLDIAPAAHARPTHKSNGGDANVGAPIHCAGSCAQGRFGEMLLVTRTGDCYAGADAALALARVIGWARPVYLVGRLPGVLPLLRTLYHHLATRRYAVGIPATVTATKTADPAGLR